MSLKNYSHEELQYLSMIELATLLLTDEKKALDFKEIFEKIAEIKQFKEEDKMDMLVQFYTDLNTDGRFMTLGSNQWGLKRWYPVDQIDEEIKVRPKKRKRKPIDDEDDDFDLIDEDDELDDEEVDLLDEDEIDDDVDYVDDGEDEFTEDLDDDIDEKIDDEEFDETFDDEEIIDEDEDELR